MSKPWVVPDAWKRQDWDSVCQACSQAVFMVAVAEKRLPPGALEVTRCPGCNRALWYRSNASARTVEDYHTRVVWATQQHQTQAFQKRKPA